MVLSIGLHDTVLCSQDGEHLLEIKILTKGESNQTIITDNTGRRKKKEKETEIRIAPLMVRDRLVISVNREDSHDFARIEFHEFNFFLSIKIKFFLNC